MTFRTGELFDGTDNQVTITTGALLGSFSLLAVAGGSLVTGLALM